MDDIAGIAAGRVSVYPSPPCAIDLVAAAAGCSQKQAKAALISLARNGFVVAPMLPTDAMLAAYIDAYDPCIRKTFSVVRGIAKARVRWAAMSKEGMKVAMSHRRSLQPHQGD